MEDYHWTFIKRLMCLGIYSCYLLLASCSKNKKEEAAPTKVTPPLTKELFQDQSFLSLVEASRVQCSLLDCPPSVLTVFVKDFISGEIKTCTGVLLNDRRLITHSDCFNSKMLTNPTAYSCARNILIKDHQNQTHFCAEIQGVNFLNTEQSAQSALTFQSQEAILLMSGELTQRLEGLALHNGALELNTDYEFWGIQQSGEKEYKIIYDRTLASQSSYLYPWPLSEGEWYRNLAFTLTSLPGGLLGLLPGGMIANDRREVFATISAANEVRELEVVRPFVMPDSALLKNYLYVQPLACIPGIGTGNSCLVLKDQGELRRLQLQLIKGWSFDQADRDLEQYTQELSEKDLHLLWDYEYVARPQGLAYETDLTVRCFKQPQKWINRYRSAFLNLGYLKSKDYIMVFPTYWLRGSLNLDYQWKSYIDQKNINTLRVEFSPRHLAREKTSDVLLYEAQSNRLIKTIADVKACP